MEKTKQDYISVPTTEPPVYQEEEEVEIQQPKKGRRLKFFLIGGAIALIGLGHLCNHKYNEFKQNSFDTNLFEIPHEVDHVESAHDLNEFMRHLDRSFGPRPCGMHFNQGPPHEHPPHHGPHGHPPPPPHGPHGHPPPPPPPHHGPPPMEPYHPAEKGNADFSNDDERTLESHHKLPFFSNKPKDENVLPKENKKFDELNNEFDGEQKLDSHRKFHGFPEENEEFDGERKLDSHHRGFPKHHRPKTLDMPPSPHHRPPHGHHGHHPPPPPGIGLLFDEDENTPPPPPPPSPHHPENECKVENLNATSTVFSFSPEQFQKTSVFLDGFFSHGSKVLLSKATDKSIQDVRVNVTLFHGDENLTKQVSLSAFDHKGKYQVEVKRDHSHGHPRQLFRFKEECLVYSIHVEFPANMEYFDAVGLRIKGAHSIEGNLDNIEFGSVKAGLGHGVIHFENLKAKKMKLGVLGGVVVGNYHVGESIAAGAIHGGIKMNVFPTAENINVTASAISGPSILNIPSDSYSGKFFVSSFSGDSTIQAPQPEDVHVTKMRPIFKNGYYKNDKDESNVVVSSKHKFATLNFVN